MCLCALLVMCDVLMCVCVGVSVIVPVAFLLFNVCVFWIVIGCVLSYGLVVFVFCLMCDCVCALYVCVSCVMCCVVVWFVWFCDLCCVFCACLSVSFV